MVEKRPDRITVTIGRKIPAEQYGSFDLRLQYEMDKPDKFKSQDAVRSLEKFVLEEMERLISIVDSKIKEKK